MKTNQSSFITVSATGVSQACNGTSSGAAIPVASDGNIPRMIRVSTTQPATFRLGWGSLPTALSTDMMLTPNAPVEMTTNGASHFACLQVAGQVTNAGVVNVVPLENL